MAIPLSLSDVDLICRTSYAVYSSFKQAPSEFQTITRELHDLNNILEDVQSQFRQPWSPLKRDSRSSANLKLVIVECRQTLVDLQSQLDKYTSLASATPKLSERVGYMTRDFARLRESMARQRGTIDTQLTLCNTGALGPILRYIYERAEEEKAGQRRSVISSADDNESNLMTVISQDLQRRNIPARDIEEHKADIEAFIEDIRVEGEIEDSTSAFVVNPADSVSVTSPQPTSRFSSSATLLQENLPSMERVSEFRGIPIHEISFGTIFNPHVDMRGARKPNTFDAWSLVVLSLYMQRKLPEVMSNVGEHIQASLSEFCELLSTLDPFLLLALSDSSTDKDFWNRIQNGVAKDLETRLSLYRSNSKDASKSRSQSSLWPFNLNFANIGAALVLLLKGVISEIDGADFNQADESTANASGAAARNSLSSLSNVWKKATFQKPYRPIALGQERFRGPQQWNKALKLLRDAFVSYLTGSDNLSRDVFEADMQLIEQKWAKRYAWNRNQAVRDEETTDETTLFFRWLLETQGLVASDSSTWHDLSNELSFVNSEARRTDKCLPASFIDISKTSDSGPIVDRATGRVVDERLLPQAYMIDRAMYMHEASIIDRRERLYYKESRV